MTIKLAVHTMPRSAGRSTKQYLFEGLDDARIVHVHGLVDKGSPYYEEGADLGFRLPPEQRDQWKVISIIREPVGRNVSHYWARETKLRQRNAGTDDAFHMYKMALTLDSHLALNFVGTELETYWGVDIYGVPFEPPFQVYDGRVGIIRFENIIAMMDLVKELTGERIRIPFPHIGAGKYPRMWIPSLYMMGLYQSRYAQHFYSQYELASMAAYWSGPYG